MNKQKTLLTASAIALMLGTTAPVFAEALKAPDVKKEDSHDHKGHKEGDDHHHKGHKKGDNHDHKNHQEGDGHDHEKQEQQRSKP